MKSIYQESGKTMAEHTRRLNLHDTTLRNIKVHLGQLAQELHRRSQGGLLSDTVVNPKGKEQCCGVTLRSGTMFEEAS